MIDRYVWLGRVVGTHGIKGEAKIISDFPFKDKAFKVGNKLYIGTSKICEVVSSYRRHKQYDLLAFDGRHSLNDIYVLVKADVYMERCDLKLEEGEFIDSDLFGMDVVVGDEVLGKIVNIFKASPTNKVIKFRKKNKAYMVPYVKNLIKNIDLYNRKVVLYSLEGVIECE